MAAYKNVETEVYVFPKYFNVHLYALVATCPYSFPHDKCL